MGASSNLSMAIKSTKGNFEFNSSSAKICPRVFTLLPMMLVRYFRSVLVAELQATSPLILLSLTESTDSGFSIE